MDNRLEAHYQNRTYYFNLVDKKPSEVVISMYGTLYTFVPAGVRWENSRANKMNMSDGLIVAVLVAIGVS
jgi:hypothetical protein